MPTMDKSSGRGGAELASMDLICFSHLRWSFVYQRPQHLLSRFAKRQRVFFFEEPEYEEAARPILKETGSPEGVVVLTPVLPAGEEHNEQVYLRALVLSYATRNLSRNFITWYYTPMALKFTRSLAPSFCVYDCMDELSNFLGAPGEMKERERELLTRADVVFTGGYSLYEAKASLHGRVYPFRSSIDREHFARALQGCEDPADQKDIPRPRAGYYGVIDERVDLEMLSAVASSRPDWQFVMIGPTAKIRTEVLPRHPNIHYLGQKSYSELPAYISNWQIALLPFSMNPSTRFISPTKVPEYLAALLPVISTPIRDVYRDYGREGLVFIADTSQRFSSLLDRAALQQESEIWRKKVDRKLSGFSWNSTWSSMCEAMEEAYAHRRSQEVARST